MARPSICENVKNRIYNMILELRLRNDFLLPAERELAATLQISRGTVRKALDMLETDGIIVRENQMTRILPVLRQKGRYAFCAASDDDCLYFVFGLYLRLWEDLRQRSGDFSIDLVMIPQLKDNCSPEKLAELKKYDIIFVSYINEKVVRDMKKADLPLVMLDEQNFDNNFPLLCMDNYKVGKFAAQRLFNAGCRNAFIIEYCMGKYKPFDLRCQGFTDEFSACGGMTTVIKNPEDMPNSLACMNFLANTIEQQLTADTDCVFYLSDEAIDMLNWYFRDKLKNNENFKIITFVGSGNFSKNCLYTEYLIMDNNTLISAMLEIIEKFENKNVLPEIFERRFSPIHYINGIDLTLK